MTWSAWAIISWLVMFALPSVAIMSLCGDYIARLLSGDEVARPLPGGKMRVVRYHTQRGKRNAFCSVGRECTYVVARHPCSLEAGWGGLKRGVVFPILPTAMGRMLPLGHRDASWHVRTCAALPSVSLQLHVR